MSQEELSGTVLFSQTGIRSGRQIGEGEVSVRRVEHEMGPEVQMEVPRRGVGAEVGRNWMVRDGAGPSQQG